VAVEGADGDEKRVDDDGFCVFVDVRSVFIDVKSVNDDAQNVVFDPFTSMMTLFRE
jgi:hypothetical protein